MSRPRSEKIYSWSVQAIDCNVKCQNCTNYKFPGDGGSGIPSDKINSSYCKQPNKEACNSVTNPHNSFLVTNQIPPMGRTPRLMHNIHHTPLIAIIFPLCFGFVAANKERMHSCRFICMTMHITADKTSCIYQIMIAPAILKPPKGL